MSHTTSAPGPWPLDRCGPAFPSEFFTGDTLSVARNLLGATLSTNIEGCHTGGTIVEVEAYGAEPDPASHGFRGQTDRNSVLFWSGGHAYVYLIYGVHFCVNVSTEVAGKGCGVLIRGLEPTIGIETMRLRRGGVRDSLLTNGPGRLCSALGITRAMNGESYRTSDFIHLSVGGLDGRKNVSDQDVVTTTRIGISSAIDFPWRFYIKSSAFVSRR